MSGSSSTNSNRLYGVFWVDVSTSSLAENGFLNIASQLKMPVSTWQNSLQGLANLKHPWMLVLDNADDPKIDYQAYFPPSPAGVVVLTSRNVECQRYATAGFVALENLPIDEATELLLKAAGVTGEERLLLEDFARAVATLLQSHPQALIQAGAFVKQGHCTLSEYPSVYVRQRRRLLISRPSQALSRYRDVYTTFEASVEMLQTSWPKSSQDALELLPLLAVCAPNKLPLFLHKAAWEGARGLPAATTDDENDLRLTKWHVSRLPSLLQTSSASWDSFRLMEAVDILEALALVSTDRDDGYTSVSMHPLVHAWARDRQNQQRQHESWIAMGSVVALSGSAHDLWRRQARQLQPHLQAATSWDMECMFRTNRATVATILVECGWLLHEMRADETLFTLLDRLCTHLGLDKSTVDPRWVRLYMLIGCNALNYGKVRDAVRLLEGVVQIRGQTLTEDHPDQLASQHELAGAYQADGQVQEAVRLLEEVVRIRGQTLTEDHPDRLVSQHALAGVYRANGQVKDAIQMLEEVVRIRGQTLTEDHPDRLVSQHALAGVYRANGQVKDAIQLLEEVVRIRGQTLTKDHPDQLASQHELAGAYQADGQVQEAVRLLEEVVRIRGQTLTEDHPDRLVSQHALAGVYRANGQVKDAIQLLEEVVRIRGQTLTEDHPDRLAPQYALAGAYNANGQSREAVSLMRHVLKIQEQTLANERFTQSVGNPIEDDQSDSNLTEVSSGPPSLTSDSTVDSMGDEYGQVVEHLVEIFCSDGNIGPIYRQAAKKLGIRKFSQNHDQLLKLYFRGLRHEVKNGTELATTRLLRTRDYRNEITSLILTSLELLEVGQGRLTPMILAERKTERNYSLNQFLTSLTVPKSDDNHEKPPGGVDVCEDVVSESDGSSTESEDESSGNNQSPLQAVDSFLTGGRAFNQLKINLTSLLRPPHTLEDALQSESEFVVKQSIAWIIDSQPSKDQETILDLRKQNLSVTEIARVLLGNAPALLREIAEEDQKPTLAENTMTADADMLKHDAALTNETNPISETAVTKSKLDNMTGNRVSQVHNEPRLVTWTCSCGMQLCDYYTELVSGSLEQLQQRLRSEHSQSSAPWTVLWSDMFTWATSRSPATGAKQKDHDKASSANPSAQATQASTLSNPSMSRIADASTPFGSQGPSTSSGNLINTPPDQRESMVSYLLLCFPEGLSGVKLCQQQILNTAPQQDLPNRVINDKQLFHLLRKTYASERRVFMHRFWPKTVIRVSLAYFLVDLSEYVELKHYACHAGGDNCRCIPPPDMIRPSNNAQYDCLPREPRVKPPIGPNYLTHYFQNPHCIKSEKLVCTLNQVPKRVGPCMAKSGTERVDGWGIEFDEGWDRGRLRNFVFGLITVGSLIFAILWSALKKDTQSAFGISGFIVGILSIVSGYIASAEPRIVHK